MKAHVLVSSKGPVQLGRELGKGGEGSVYEIQNQPSVVAKIWHKDPTPERIEKLCVMTGLLTPKLSSLTAWPSDILRGPGGKVVGFLMSNIGGAKDIHHLYTPKSRLAKFPQADWRLLVRAALNTARAFALLHEAGFLVADVNHGGIAVAQDATVKLIDCDSFQVTYGSKTFICEVGMENFTPPELQGQSFRGVTRTANHDNFGLAVTIFQLLMIGRHPFAGRHLGKGDLSIGEAIAQFKYAYSRDKARTQMEPPPMTPPVAVAGAGIGALWEQAFGPAGAGGRGRPTAEQWVHALLALETSFAKCGKHAGHYYARGIECPWCPVEASGLALFPLPMGLGPAPLGGPFSLDSVWAQIVAIQSPTPAPLPTAARPTPSAEARAVASSRNQRRISGFVAAGAVVIAALAMNINLFFAGIGAWLLYIWVSGRTPAADISKFQLRRQAAETDLRALTERWEREATPRAFDEKLSELGKLREEWLGLPKRRQERYVSLVHNREQDARTKYLDQFDIDGAVISGIGPAKKAMLESYGIETAADINRHAVLRVPGFGPALTQRLLDWRATKERGFRFDPQSGVDPRYIADLDRSISQRKNEIETALRKGPADLHHVRGTILTRRQALEGAMRQAVERLAQAGVDLKVVQ